MLQGELYRGCFLIWCDQVICILEKAGQSCLKTCICSDGAHTTAISSALMNLLFAVCMRFAEHSLFCFGFFLLNFLARSCMPECSWEYNACLPEDVCMCLRYLYKYSGVCSCSIPLPLHTIARSYDWESTIVPGSNCKSTVIQASQVRNHALSSLVIRDH